MSIDFIKIKGSNHQDDCFELNSQIEDLKAQLRVADLQLKEKELKFGKRVEDYETQLGRISDENKSLKDKYEKIFEAQRKLEKQNSNLEDRLLNIVEKYEAEQKTLLEELTIAHSKLVESKLIISDLEREKESYRQDCNIAVNLLQCKPADFMSHSYNSLPVNLKDRLKSLLSVEEILRFEDQPDDDPEADLQKKPNTLFKIPIFQPTAAAAMMYNVQSSSQQREKQRKLNKNDEANLNPMFSRSSSHLSSSNSYVSIHMGDTDSEIENRAKKLNDLSGVADFNQSNENLNNNGKICSSLIAQVLKKDTDSPSKKSYKLFPYICLRCKKELLLCDSSSQTNGNDLLVNQQQDQNSKIMYASKKASSMEPILRSKTVATGLSDMTNSNYAQTRITEQTSLLKLNETINSTENRQNNAKTIGKDNHRNRIDSWTDDKLNLVTY